MEPLHYTEQELIELITTEVTNHLQTDSGTIDIDEEFYEIGIDSLSSVTIVAAIEQRLHVTLEPTVLWDYPTIRSLAKFISIDINKK